MINKEYEEIISSNLKELGLKKEGVVLVHSSLKSLGTSIGGPGTLINAIMDALGPSGTLLMPALSEQYVHEENPFFNVVTTPTNTGAIPEYFRKMDGVIRSINPTHSVCGYGKYAKEILGKHHLDETPCGKNSPFYLLPKYEGQIVFIGCGLKPNTSMHAIEELVEPDYLFKKMVKYEVVGYDNKKISLNCMRHNFVGWEQRYDRVETILQDKGLKTGKILSATCHIVETPVLWERCTEQYKKNSHSFVDRIGSEE